MPSPDRRSGAASWPVEDLRHLHHFIDCIEYVRTQPDGTFAQAGDYAGGLEPAEGITRVRRDDAKDLGTVRSHRRRDRIPAPRGPVANRRVERPQVRLDPADA